MTKRLKATAVAIGIATGLGLGAAQAATINQGLVNGFNLIIDESREAYIDNPGGTPDGRFGVGDVVIGYFKIDNFNTKPASANNQVYAVFSQQVTSCCGTNGSSITFGATTVAGLTLDDLIPGPAPAGSVFAMYDRSTPYPVDLISAAPGGATSMKDYIDFITGNGNLAVIGGFGGTPLVPPEFLVSSSSFAGAPTASFINLASSVTVASTGAALSVLVDNVNGWDFNNDVPSVTPPGFAPFILSQSSLGVSAGTVSGVGAASPSPQTWLSVAGYNGGALGTLQQCTSALGVNTACGFIDKNNFNVDVKAVPEPGTLLLVSAALLAAGGVARRRKA